MRPQETPDPDTQSTLTTALDWLAQHQLVAQMLAIVLVMFLAYLADKVAKRFLLATVARLVRGTAIRWDDRLLERRVFERISHFAPALAVYHGIRLVPELPVAFVDLVQQTTLAVMVLIGVLAASDIYATSSLARGRPIKGIVQVAKIIIYILGAILAISAVTGQNPLLLLSGFGAMTAVLLIVFRDTILSFVASIQISSYDMMRVGDWVEMPQYGADGDVVDIGLHTIKVQNWDKTITAIPTHKFLTDSFKNWRSMPQSGGRRIKRALHIDMNSIRFLDEADIERFGKFQLIREYIANKKQELDDYNAEHASEPGVVANARRLTNIGTFRAYVVQYLRQHPKIHDQLTLMVRQLDPTPSGVPLQIYAFSNDVAWVSYEGIQSDIFDHIMAIVPEFGLKLYQQPSGSDIEGALSGPRTASRE